MSQTIETKIIGKDVWWDNEKQIFRKKRINLEKIPLIFRCPLCGKVVAPPHERRTQRREVTDKWKIRRHNKKVLDVYFERDKPPKEKFNIWHDRIRTEHEDEFLKHVYVEYFEDPLILRINHAFYGIRACTKCIRNRPSHVLKESINMSKKLIEPDKKIRLRINGKLRLTTKVIEIKNL